MILILQIVIGVIIGEALWSCFELLREHVIEPRIRGWQMLRSAKKSADKIMKLKIDGKKAKVEFGEKDD